MLDQQAHASPPGLLRAEGSWDGQQLVRALADASGVPAEFLSVARQSASSRTLSRPAVRSLQWDEPALTRATSLAEPPLQLRDADELICRDARHALPDYVAPRCDEPSVLAVGRRVGEAAAPPEIGVRIRTVFDGRAI